MVRSMCVVSCCLLALLLITSSSGYPSVSNYYRDDGQVDPEDIAAMMDRLSNLIAMERKLQKYNEDLNKLVTSEKRGLDLGLGRGYSGSLQAKHLMGIAAANYAGGPGRKRRSVPTPAPTE